MKNYKWGHISFDEYGFAIIFQPHWSLYILIGFVGINIYLKREGEE